MKTSLVAVDFHGDGCADCAVRGFSVCASLDQIEMREFEQLSRRVSFETCATVFAQEDTSSCFYNLLDGVMRLYKLLPDGRRQIVGFVLPGDFVGMTTEQRHGFSADAIGPITVCQFAKVPFSRFAEDKPNLLRRMNELAVQELNHARDHMVLLGRRSAEEKVATFLVSWRDRLVELRGPSNIVPLPMSRQDIADYLGLTIETVSRTFTKLEREGIIAILPGGVSLRDSARAEALAAA
ncbi:nitrogen fixation regulation protein FixK [Bradyrhizobium oligotrophicum S58]|uniref:Nitrogen fixation regulation protein FixK n=1 Tax=Bradyrhizobium oligotrophicum S58 TaxID=1245469 RepID=M4Z4Q4_9BRAD|nr:helix-turn-helix domain-containing protein [Bradyrhizobium oligotrophicum]BAM88408.1 nitrogen fixation regulation protein FixK [Bradyrhizobium oligotrophicum S58]